MPGLLACKAAEFQGGQEAHWGMFDRVQRAHIVECRNIADPQVLRDCARGVGLDVTRWERDWRGEAVAQAVKADLEEAERRGIHAVPTVVFDDRSRLQGAVSEERYRSMIEALLAG